MHARSTWIRIRRRVRYWFNQRARHRLLGEEMEFHIDSMADDFAAQGMTEAEARAAARRKFGNMTVQAEEARSIWITRWMSDLAQDLRLALRTMRRDAGFTMFAILIAGLGIGASSTVFSVVNALLLRPLPFKDPEQLVWISNMGMNDAEYTTQVNHFLDLRARNRSFADLAGINGFYAAGDREMTGAGEPERLTSVPVTQNLFALLGVAPILGRTFTEAECRARYNSPPAAVLSYGFWQRRYAGDPRVLGQTVMLNNQPVAVVGVMPASFDFSSVFAPGTNADLFIPWPLTDETNRRGNTTKIVGRLKPGVTLKRAQAEFTQLGQQLEKEHPERNGVAPKLALLKDRVSGGFSRALMVLAGAVAVVMLIVCANLSNLQLARMAARQKEMAMRTALGAGRLRLLRQVFAESLALSSCGATLGLALAILGTRRLAHLASFKLPLLASIRLDGVALAFTALAAILTGVLFGLLPALQVPALTAQDALKETSRGLTGGRAQAWLRSALVVAEIAFACVLLVGAGLLMRSLVRVLDVDLGFQPERAAALRVDPSFRMSGLLQQNSFLDDMLRRARAIPGIKAAGVTDVLPLAGDRSWGIAGKGQVYDRGKFPEAFIRVVTDGYFEAAGVALRAGRYFSPQDRVKSEPVAIVNESLARTLWPGQNPIGQVLTQDGGRRVVGMVADVRHEALEKNGGGEMYLPMRQTGDYGAMILVLRTALPPDALASSVRGALRPLDPNLPVAEFQTLEDLVSRAVSPRRFLVTLLAGFAAFALVLASLGIYAVISYSVSQRVQEIGIRMALGASAAALRRQILLRTLGLAALGLAAGLLASRFITAAIGSLLFGVTAGDPLTFAGMAALLAAVAALAGYIPAWKASRMDPMIALRAE